MKYEDEDIIITKGDEVFRYCDIKDGAEIDQPQRLATSEEMKEYLDEEANHRKEAEQNQQEMYYHDLPD